MLWSKDTMKSKLRFECLVLCLKLFSWWCRDHIPNDQSCDENHDDEETHKIHGIDVGVILGEVILMSIVLQFSYK